MKYGLIKLMQPAYPVASMCQLLGVSESGYYAWRVRTPSKRERENARLEIEIKAAHQRTRETYSATHLHNDLADHGVQTTAY